MKCLIADLVTEINPKYVETKTLAAKFEYKGDRPTDLTLSVPDDYIDYIFKRSVEGTTKGQMENYALSRQFFRETIEKNILLVHSSALIHKGGAYLFSADSGVGKSTHTKLWLKAFGSDVHIMNDDKPAVRLYGDKAVAYGTPFDGGSGIALNESYPLKAIVFIERGEENSVRKPSTNEILQRLYFQTAHMVSAQVAQNMLQNFDDLLSNTDFYILKCNMDISAAYTAFDEIIKKAE